MSTRTPTAPAGSTTAPRSSGPDPDGVTDRGAWVSLAVVAGGLFLAVLSTTVVTVALPSIGASLQVGPTGMEWIVDAYVLVYATLLVAGGVLGDRYGRRRVFLVGTVLFAAGSLLTGLAPSVPVLLVGRALQGVGPALLVPGSLAIIRATFSDERRRATAIGLWSMSAGLAMALGPVLGGLLVGAGGWRWVFLFNVPLALVLLAVAARSLPALRSGDGRGRFDWAGVVLSTLGVAFLVFAVIEGQTAGWTSAWVLTGAGAGVVALAGFVQRERTHPEPLVDVRLFRNRTFTIANVGAFVVFFAFIGLIVYLSSFFQTVQGRSPIVAGLAVAVLGVALAVSSALAGRLVDRLGERTMIVVGLALSGAATLALLLVGPGSGVGELWWQFVLVGVGIGMCGTVTTTIAMSAVGAERAGMASAIVNAVRQIGQVFGVAVLGALVYGALPGGTASGRLDPAGGALFVDGLHDALAVSGVALLAVSAVALVLLPRREAAG